MVHLRIIVPNYQTDHVVDLLRHTESVTNLILLPGASQKPEGDVILCDVARHDGSVIIADLTELDVDVEGSIAVEEIDAQISRVAELAEEAADAPTDPVLWEQVESRTSENAELSIGFLIFLTAASLIAAVGILLDELILIVGAMVVGPEFGPIAGFCVAVVNRKQRLAGRSFAALALGFPLAILATYLSTLALKEIGEAPEQLLDDRVTGFIADPGFFSFYVAVLAGAAGVLSLTTAKSGALIGVLISVTTVPAAANVAVAAAYSDWGEVGGAAAQLGVNIAGILVAGITTLYIQRLIYIRRKARHLHHAARQEAGLPVGHIRHRRAGRAKD